MNSIYGLSFVFCFLVGLFCVHVMIMYYIRAYSFKKTFSCEAVFHVCVFVLLLSPTLGLVSNHVWGLAADRYVYMPSAIVLVPFLALCLERLCSSSRYVESVVKSKRMFLCVVVFLPLVIQTHSMVRNWSKPRVFWKHMIESDPTDAVPYNNYGNVLNRAGEYQDAVSHYRIALSLNQEYTEAWFNMANATLSDVILRKLFTYNELKKLFNEAHSVSTGTGGQGEDFKIGASEAVDMMVRGLRVDPQYPINFFSLAGLFERIDRYDEAYDIYRQLSSDPQYSKLALSSMRRLSGLVTGSKEGVVKKSSAVKKNKNKESGKDTVADRRENSDESRMIRAAEKLWKEQNNINAAKRLLRRVLKHDASNSGARQLMREIDDGEL